MAEQPQGWRIVVIANVLPIVEALIEQLREMGHDVVAWLMHEAPGVPSTCRRRPGARRATRRRRRAST